MDSEYIENDEQAMLAIALATDLHSTRQEPGLPIFWVAEIIKQVFAREEVESLIRELQKNGSREQREQRKQTKRGEAAPEP